MDKSIPVGSLADLLFRLWQHLSRRRQRQFWLLMGMMLVSAFAGQELVMVAYRKAVEERYRFFCYGDCMLVV